MMALLAGFAVLSAAVAAGWTAPLDQATTAAAAAHRTSFLSDIAINATALGSGTVVFTIAICVALYAVAAGRPRIALALVWVPVASLLDNGVKLLLRQPRPTAAMVAVPSTFGFPSGHTVAAAALFLTLALVAAGAERRAGARRVLLACGLAVTLLVAWSRVYLGVHYLSDVVGGLLLGAAGSVAAVQLIDRKQMDRQGLSDSDA
jgi:undecaprenyl-diphosphatase